MAARQETAAMHHEAAPAEIGSAGNVAPQAKIGSRSAGALLWTDILSHHHRVSASFGLQWRQSDPGLRGEFGARGVAGGDGPPVLTTARIPHLHLHPPAVSNLFFVKPFRDRSIA